MAVKATAKTTMKTPMEISKKTLGFQGSLVLLLRLCVTVKQTASSATEDLRVAEDLRGAQQAEEP